MLIWQQILVTGVVGLGSALQGAVGFGLGVLAVPLLVLIDPSLVPGPILFASGFLTLVMVRREREAVRHADLKWSLSGRALGIGAAMAVLSLVPVARLGLLFGGLILAAVGLSVFGLRLPATPAALLGAGALSGFMGTSVSIGGPPIALIYQNESGPSIRATLSAYFTVGTVLSLVGLHLVGRFGMPELLHGLTLLPGVGIGFLASRRLTHQLDEGLIRPAILLASGGAAIAVVLKTIL